MSLWSRLFAKHRRQPPRWPLLGTKFEILGTVGRGAFGEVFAARSLESGGIHALKCIRASRLTAEEEQLVRREAEAWIALGRHPHVVEAHFLERIDGRLYLAMALVGPDSTGVRTLAGHLRQEGAEPESVLRWGIQIARGMHHASQSGVRAHRDLKPSNVLIDEKDVVKVGDWGLGVVGFQADHGIAGTTQYMAPEQLRATDAADARSDVYSVGVLLYELATGSLPPRTSGAASRGPEGAPHPAVDAPELERPLRDVLERCLRRDPSERYADFAELEGALASVLASDYGGAVPVLTLAEPEATDWSNRGMSLYHLGRYSEALEAFERAAAMDPDSALYWANQGDALRALGRFDDALALYEKACGMRSVRGWYKKGNLHAALGRHADAIACYRGGLRLDREDVITLNNLGCELNAIGEHRQALRCLDRALDLEPRMADARYNRGQACYRLGRMEEAAADFAEVGRLSPLRADSVHCRALTLWKLGREDQAMKVLQHALDLNPLNALSWYERGNMLASQKRFGDAGEAFERSIELGGVPEAVERLRWVEEDLGKEQLQGPIQRP